MYACVYTHCEMKYHFLLVSYDINEFLRYFWGNFSLSFVCASINVTVSFYYCNVWTLCACQIHCSTLFSNSMAFLYKNMWNFTISSAYLHNSMRILSFVLCFDIRICDEWEEYVTFNCKWKLKVFHS